MIGELQSDYKIGYEENGIIYETYQEYLDRDKEEIEKAKKKEKKEKKKKEEAKKSKLAKLKDYDSDVDMEMEEEEEEEEKESEEESEKEESEKEEKSEDEDEEDTDQIEEKEIMEMDEKIKHFFKPDFVKHGFSVGGINEFTKDYKRNKNQRYYVASHSEFVVYNPTQVRIRYVIWITKPDKH